MASGKTHDKINLVTGGFFSGVVFVYTLSLELFFCFIIGWLFATLIFGPDTDIMPKKRAGVLRYFLYPYSLFFKHRGLSHSLLLGTLTRIVYGIFALFCLIQVLYRFDYLEMDGSSFLNMTLQFLKGFDLNQMPYKMVSLLFLGMFGADLCHIFVDRISSFFKRIFS